MPESETDEQGQTQRERILDAAMRVFARKGFKGASVREIAAEAGVTTGAIYYHYADKDDLLANALKRDVHYSFSLSPVDANGRKKDREAFLGEVYAATTNRLCDQDRQHLHQILAAEVLTLSPEEQALHEAVYEEAIRKTEEEFPEALDVPREAENARYLASILMAALDGMAIQTSLGVHEDDTERLAQVFCDFFATSITSYLNEKPGGAGDQAQA